MFVVNIFTLRSCMNDLNGQNEEQGVLNTLSKFQPGPTVDEGDTLIFPWLHHGYPKIETSPSFLSFPLSLFSLFFFLLTFFSLSFLEIQDEK